MQRLALGAFVLGSLLTACGSDSAHNNPPSDAPTNHAVCGDGIVDVSSETCDDGNTTSGDGCSATCQTETVNKCGNGAIDSGEVCDDGNTAGGDGCNAACIVEQGYMCTGTPSVCTMMTTEMGTCASPMTVTLTANGALYTGMGAGDTSTSTNQVGGAPCDAYSNDGVAADHIWTFVNPIAQPVKITMHPLADSYDGVLRLTTAACDVATAVPENASTSDGCADLGGSMGDESLNYSMLAAGTYYIVIDGYRADDIGTYSFDIHAGHGNCGDGVIDFNEACDDHNTATGDGCDGTCQVEAGYACDGAPSVCVRLCGNGVLDDGETCDDQNNNANDGCSATCQIETGYACSGEPSVCHHIVCGDGIVEGAETCDDHNTTPDDGCDATCHTETGYTCFGSPSTCLFGGTCAQPYPLTLTAAGAGFIGHGASDTTNATNGFDAAACDSDTIDAGPAGDQTWVFTNPVAQPVVITTADPSFDIILRLTKVACDVTTSVPDDDGNAMDGCADLHGSGTGEILNYDMLPAGTYYLTVDGYANDSVGPYAFTLKAGNTAVCGDGNLDAGEMCDDHNAVSNDGCSSTCQIETGYVCTGSPSVCHIVACGDGIVDSPEECDSSGAHDRCSSTCTLVFDTTDTENNDDKTHAQTITPAHHIIKGSLPVGDLDVYKFTLTAPSVVNLESYTTFESTYTSTSDSTIANLECQGADTQIRVFASTADPTVDADNLYNDDDSGDSVCSFLDPGATLAAGTYYFTIHEYQSNDAISRYLVDFKVTPM